MNTNKRNDKFEIISGSLDETIKIWDEFFDLILVINLNNGKFDIIRD